MPHSIVIGRLRYAAFPMLAVLFAVQACFVVFFVCLRRRARRLAQDPLNTEWSDLQRGHVA